LAAWVLALGGALFVASDALLATNKFAAALPAASLWMLGTYWLAQWCIASWLPAARPATKAGSPPSRGGHGGPAPVAVGNPLNRDV
jgi:hypothetical protein